MRTGMNELNIASPAVSGRWVMFIRLLALPLAVLLVTGYSSLVNVFAANPASLNLQVTVVPTLSISVDKGDYNFGSMPVNTTSISTSAILVTNDSSGRTEDFRIQANNTANWTLSPSTNSGTDQFMLRALVHTAQPTVNDFEADYSTISASIENMDARYSVSGSSCNNVSAIPGQNQRTLWFMMLTPKEVTSIAEQDVTVTITAVDAGQF